MKTTKTKVGAAVAFLVLETAVAGSASAQASDPQKNGGAGQAAGPDQMQTMEGMDHSQMDHSKMDHSRTSQGSGDQTKAVTPTKGAGTDQPPSAGQAGTMEGMDHSQMDHSQMDHSQMAHSQQDHEASHQMQSPKPAPQRGSPSMGHGMAGMGHGKQMGSMQDMKMGPMQGGSPPPDARDPDAYAEGTSFANLPGNEMNDGMRFGRVLLNKFEYAKDDGEHGQNVDAEAWYGDDYNKAWFKAESERRGGRLATLRTEALWDRTFATFWSTQLGVRHDTGGGDSRNWLAFGVRGLAPYWFDTEATGYWSGGTFAARFNVRYELLFTQRLILEPQVEANLYSRSDADRGLGSGLSDLELGLRLRYEIRRQFAPYVGVTWNRNFGGTADYARARGERNKTTQLVAGVRIWF